MNIDTSIGFNTNIEMLKGRKDPEAIKAVAKEMEALFAYEMLKAMRETTETFSKGSFSSNTYMSMFDMELARILSNRGLGLQDVLLKGLTNEVQKQDTKPEYKQRSEIRDIKDGLNLPVKGVISSHFGMRTHPVYGDSRFHHGIDIAAPEGTEIYPIRSGRVVYSGYRLGYGNVVEIDHGDGLMSIYAHNRMNLVKDGDEVDSNTIIAQVGNTGTSTGHHLHFEIKYKGERIDPAQVIAMR